MARRLYGRGFILPTVVIASVILLSVLAVTASTVTGAVVSMNQSYLDDMASDAAQSGLSYANSCIDSGGIGAIVWSGSVALYPSGGCSGGTSCTDPACYIVNNNNIRTTFSLTATVDTGGVAHLVSVGKMQLISPASGSVYKTYTYTLRDDRSMGGADSFFVRSIIAGEWHSCAVGVDNKAYCWGRNDYGELGDGTTTQRATPVAVLQGAMPAGVTIRQMTAGYFHTCAIGSDNRAYCWGENNYGQIGDGTGTTRTVPALVGQGAMPAGVTVKSIASGVYHNCAGASDGGTYCWGYNLYGQLGNGSTANSSLPVAVGQGSVPTGVSIMSLGAGFYHTCGLASNYKVYCWGYGAYGQLGNGSTATRTTPYPVAQGAMPVGATIKSLTAGYHDACVIASDNKAYCWGQNGYGQIGNNTTTNQVSPVAVVQGSIPAGVTAMVVAAGTFHTCMIGSDGNVYCWGYNAYGQLGDNSTTDSLSPVRASQGSIAIGTTMRTLSLGYHHVCGISTSNQAYCWGYNNNLQVGDGTQVNRLVPTAVHQNVMPSDVSDILTVSTGGSTSCGTVSNGKLVCWGSSSNGQLGNGLTSNQLAPGYTIHSTLPSGVGLQAVSVGAAHTCAIGSDRMVYCWGANSQGQLGDGTATDRTDPVSVSMGAVPAGVWAQSVAAGGGHTCMIGSNGKAYCWGNNSSGQLGDGTTVSKSVPVAVAQGAMPVGSSVWAIATGDNHSCAIVSDGKIYCWGSNSSGQLGDGTTVNKPVPVAVAQGAMPAGFMTQVITAGSAHSCAISMDRKAYCWGDNTTGQLGDGTTTNRLTAVVVAQGAMPSGLMVHSVSAGAGYTCVIALGDGKDYCWGLNNLGQLGDGTTTNRLTAVVVAQGAIPSGMIAQAIATGADHACLIATNNQTYCWGANNLGQVGDGTTTSRLVPTAALAPPKASQVGYQLYY